MEEKNRNDFRGLCKEVCEAMEELVRGAVIALEKVLRTLKAMEEVLKVRGDKEAVEALAEKERTLEEVLEKLRKLLD